MTISQPEFMRSLLPLKQHYRIEIDDTGSEVVIAHRSFRVILQLHENKPVELGSLNMPSMEVLFKYEDSTGDEIALFLKRFDLCFRRGGG
ncbi:MAG: hypothetical protein PVI97_09850 [Candidatus Thiodiazotropha sp.]|jgi:hypothetical protein